MKTINVKINRGGSYQEYAQVPVEEGMSVMDVLELLYETKDNTLAFFRHEACHQEACGKCLVKANGKVCLACGTEVCGDLVLDPWSSKVVRDLVCE
ncbi:MAG: hypothetical protein HUJ80_06045 [Firmicutes bacterium]|nr:hypothetical protein [Bacillota bacterium]